ncbi:acetate kinase [Sulfurimonas lithotrophica]|uniref:Acetate kinase n=1 Tax=Sulfurimonas lithotrophica TaxID=2590022 RepID=A0A5P8P1P8_9BACT|nr:acetate kinase [Sulfurimonas lithotrophica]QFR49585.1 acetate kinase [Sulfurimonas lithotrophica]
MKLAVINSGSSSLKFKLFDMKDESVIFKLNLEEITSHSDALDEVIKQLDSMGINFHDLDAVGHRVVHGGEKFKKATLVTNEVIKDIDSLSLLAPLHNPANLQGIISVKKIAPELKQYAVFDTAFHSTMAKEAFLYALPYEMYEKYGIRRYGFHGTSHFYIAKETAKRLNKPLSELNIISMHLGNGESICAIENGKSIDTSMGFTPLEGLIMGTRSGDIDPAIVLYLQRTLGYDVGEMDTILNKKSGLKGICGKSDVRSIIASDDEKSKLALDMMVRRVRKYIGAYMSLMDRLDAVVFTGGIGEHSSYIRDRIMKNMDIKNMFVIDTDEELEIARQII